MRADERVRVVEQAEREAQGLSRGGGAKRLEGCCPDVRRRVTGQGRNVSPGQRSVLGQEPDGVEPHDAARVAEQRHQPRPRARRQTVELGRDLHHVFGALYERLDEAVDSPLVALAEPAERSDARSAHVRLVAAQRRSRIVRASSASPSESPTRSSALRGTRQPPSVEIGGVAPPRRAWSRPTSSEAVSSAHAPPATAQRTTRPARASIEPDVGTPEG